MVSIEFLITSLVVVLIPGTGVLYTISTGLFQGGRASLYAALGCTLGIVPSLMASVLGLSALMHSSALVFQIVKFAGVAYLLYLAWSMWKQTGRLVLEENRSPMNGYRTMIRGVLINTLNPKLTLFFLAFLPQFVPAQVDAPLMAMLVLGGVFMVMTLVVFMLYGMLAHYTRHYVVESPRVAHYMQRTFAGIFALLGAKLAFAER